MVYGENLTTRSSHPQTVLPGLINLCTSITALHLHIARSVYVKSPVLLTQCLGDNCHQLYRQKKEKMTLSMRLKLKLLLVRKLIVSFPAHQIPTHSGGGRPDLRSQRELGTFTINSRNNSLPDESWMTKTWYSKS